MILVRERSALVVEHDIRLLGAEHFIQLLVAAVLHGNIGIGIFFREFFERILKFHPRKAAQIADIERVPLAVRDF